VQKILKYTRNRMKQWMHNLKKCEPFLDHILPPGKYSKNFGGVQVVLMFTFNLEFYSPKPTNVHEKNDCTCHCCCYHCMHLFFLQP
jgi:hypothetical protein